MRITTARVLATIATSAALVLSGGGVAHAIPGGPANDFDYGVDLDDVGGEDGSFEFEEAADPSEYSAAACPEVKKPAKYKISWKSKHIPSLQEPVSSVLSPGDSISYKTKKQSTFGFDVKTGVEAEAGVVFAKAKTKIEGGISKSWTSGTEVTVKSKNDTNKKYRAVLGNQGWRVSYTKTKIVAPCTVKTTKGSILYPVKGDLTFGRYAV